ncbi:MAG: Fmu (Sun) domain-containing protein, partial [Thermoprotei archaeon]
MESKPKIKLDEKMLIVLLEALRWSERIKPSQHAKRMVFEKHRVSDRIERVLTAIYYSVLKRQGILDKIIEDITNVRPIYIF